MKIKGVDLSYCQEGHQLSCAETGGREICDYPCGFFHQERCYYG